MTNIQFPKDKGALNSLLEFIQKLKTGGWKIPPYSPEDWTKIINSGIIMHQASQTKDEKEKTRLQNEAQRQF